MNPEHIPRINDKLKANYDALNDQLCDHFDTHESLTDAGLEGSLYIVEYADHLTRLLVEEPSAEAWATVYKAIHFSYCINDLLLCGGAIAVGAYFSDMDLTDWRDKVLEETQAYMSQNEYLDDITGAYLPELDRTGRYGDIVETVVALISMQMQYANDVKMSEQQIAQWDGTLTELL